MIQLTKKGKEIYGNHEIEIIYSASKCAMYCFKKTRAWYGHILASNPTELKALIDLKLVEIV